MSKERYYSTGRRKSSTARVWVSEGEGKFIVNNKDVNNYLIHKSLANFVTRPLKKIEGKSFDIFSTVKGSGLSGQAGALLLGLSRALVKFDENFKPLMREDNFLTRDSRVVERKKYGQKKARRRFQFCKR